MKIIYTGGGTMGSVSPLIAIHQQLNKQEKVKALWLGTRTGPERDIVEKEGIEFKSIIFGKFRRYFDLRNILDLFKVLIAVWQSFFILIFFRPNIVLSAGGFVSVPVVWVSFVLGIPVLIHQQDIQPGLANRLMAPFARKITVALDKSLEDYPESKTVLVGNPVHKRVEKKLDFEFNNNLPNILITGGGTGASKINNLVWDSVNELTQFCNIIHLTGKDKKEKEIQNDKYICFEFLKDEMFSVLKLADIIVSRAGLSSFTELAYLKKPSVIIPIPNSHQEDNAQYFADRKACIYLDQSELNKEKFIKEIKNLINNEEKKKELGNNLHNSFIDYSGEKIIKQICQIQKN
ncbi:MAG: UDP-N-acetylglucosamine--N-acetylmuramyl-(pentapeptide) pyrophosphoryl-undecaprenol N-acetylglucosamine transferase [Patescibacteria group bacterium]